MDDRYKAIVACPFRVNTVTSPSLTIPGEIYTRSEFAPCLREDCPAFRSERGSTFYNERCLRLEQKEN